jgi:hypothetical protein
MLKEYKLHSFFLDNNSVVNRISRFMRANLTLIGKYTTRSAKDFDYNILQDENHELIPEKLELMKTYLEEYKSFKKSLRHDLNNSFTNLDSFTHYLRKQCELNISTNDSELADYAVEITYGGDKAMVEFAWKMFPDGIIENIMRSSSGIIKMPVQDDYGNINYLWNTYAIKEFEIGDLYEK